MVSASNVTDSTESVIYLGVEIDNGLEKPNQGLKKAE
jgi:hypothetical protein